MECTGSEMTLRATRNRSRDWYEEYAAARMNAIRRPSRPLKMMGAAFAILGMYLDEYEALDRQEGSGDRR